VNGLEAVSGYKIVSLLSNGRPEYDRRGSSDYRLLV